MDWIVWLIAFGMTPVPVGGLLLDRLFDLPARRYFALVGAPWLVVTAGLLAYAFASGLAVGPLLVWGAIGGLLGTVALDAVRLYGVSRGAFPLDMPRMFGIISLGLAPAMQRQMMARMVEVTAGLSPEARRQAMAPRVQALARLNERRREVAVAGMMAGLARLPEEQRQGMLQTQMALLAELPAPGRRAIMATMDRVMARPGSDGLPYGQPRGMPRLPMAIFRELATVALPRTAQEAGAPLGLVLLLGYVWHFVMGATFGVQYTLLFGGGSWALAIGWGVFVWLTMMISMPPMMPMIRFPAWFPIVPLIAHVAFALPLAWVALTFLPAGAGAGSLVGVLGWLR